MDTNQDVDSLELVSDDELMNELVKRFDICTIGYFKRGGGEYDPEAKRHKDKLGAITTFDVLKTGWLIATVGGVIIPNLFEQYRKEHGSTPHTDPTEEDKEKFKKWMGLEEDDNASEGGTVR